MEKEDTVVQLARSDLSSLVANVVGMASAYEKYARRHSTIRPAAETDPLFTTRLDDFKRAADTASELLQDVVRRLDENSGVVLASEEVALLQKDPVVLRALADYHDYKSREAEGAGFHAPHHAERAQELRTAVERLSGSGDQT